jgi:hypothetical protein
VLDLFAYERSEDQALVIAAGIPGPWLEGRGVAMSGLYTPYGRLSYSLRKAGDRILLHVDGGMRVPPGGIVFPWPRATPPGAARINGRPATWRNDTLTLHELPADVVVNLTNPRGR